MVRLIVADDHEVVRAGISAALSNLDRIEIVAEVSDGPELFWALETYQPDLIVLDVSMPQFEPLQAISEIRQAYPELKILVVSAYDDDVYVQGLLRVGIDGYHLKDQSLADLRLAVQRILAGERWLSSSLLSRLMSQPEQPVFQLTPRQRELIWCLQQGDDNQTIAQRLNLSVKTVENHLTRLYRQLNVNSRLEAVRIAAQHPDLARPLVNAHAFAPSGIILVVDDNQRYRQQLQRMLQSIAPHTTVLEASHSTEALEIVRQQPPQLAFVDVVLGDEDGIQCASAIRQAAEQTRIVLVSAYPDRAFQRRGLEAGALAFVDKKDLDRASLRQILEDCLRES